MNMDFFIFFLIFLTIEVECVKAFLILLKPESLRIGCQ
jgi:hypothetical protein